MRKAILDGLVPEFSGSPFPGPGQAFGNMNKMNMVNINNMNSMFNQNKMNMMMNQRPGMMQNQGMMSRGGQLVVAGSVVGQWGGNFGGQGRGGHNRNPREAPRGMGWGGK